MKKTALVLAAVMASGMILTACGGNKTLMLQQQKLPIPQQQLLPQRARLLHRLKTEALALILQFRSDLIPRQLTRL